MKDVDIQAVQARQCKYCAAGDVRILMQHGAIHRIGWQNIQCTASRFGFEEGDWADGPTHIYVPRRLRRQGKIEEDPE